MALQTRQDWEMLERQILAPYATLSACSQGRVHQEPQHPFRSEYQRDRDRIIHSTAFRRLEYKTQVVVNGTGDHFRTRLTHTIEVAAIARSAARTLRLNEDLTETLALAHDLGHPPFGHSGEDALQECMAGHGGFEHNRQSLRIVDELEIKYPQFNGLNLTQQVRDGLARGHAKQMGKQLQPSLEAQVADAADEIAYCCHDLDDAWSHGLIQREALETLVPLCQSLREKIQSLYPAFDSKRRHRFLIRSLVDFFVNDLCRQSMQNIEEAQFNSSEEAMHLGKRAIALSAEAKKSFQQLRSFLYQFFYAQPKILHIKTQTSQILTKLFGYYLTHPDHIGEKFATRIATDGLERSVCDYVSGMTDRYALQMYAEHLSGSIEEFTLSNF